MRELILDNARVVTMRGGHYSTIDRAAVRVRDGSIAWLGPSKEARARDGAERVDLEGAVVTPGLIDCHTHLVYAGNRAVEFEARLHGKSYQEIARDGGGIVSTVRATRAASEAQLRRESEPRLSALAGEGVTTVEIKSGYGLDLDNELKCLRVARSFASDHMRVRTTLLAAHTVPPEFSGRSDEYLDRICNDVSPAAARTGLADAVDAFCENIAFSGGQTRRVFECARAHGLRVKLHADQLSNGNGAALAAEFGALSADHLEHTDDAGVEALARAGTVAVLLPGAFYYLRETRLPPVEALRRARVPIAIASDCNPGTSPIASPLAVMNLACTLFRLTPEEALAGMTCHAARALGLHDEIGTLELVLRSDLAVWPVEPPAVLAAQIGMIAPRAVFVGGVARAA
jgi:imidazolonepropionase